MSNSKQITLKGKAYWLRVFPENKDATGYDNMLADQGGQYTLDLDLDDDSLNELMSSGSQAPSYPKEGKDNDDKDITVYRFKRLHEKRGKGGELLDWASGAPKVTDDTGAVWHVEDKGFLGNGTEVEVVVTVYKAGKMIGTRLESVKVIDLVAPPEQELA